VRSISFSYFSASTLMALGEHYLREGAFESAARYLEEPLTLAAASGQTSLLPYLQIPMAAWDLWNERPHEALRRLEPLLGTPVFETSLDHRAMQIAAEAYLAMEDARAGELIARGLDQATGQGNQLARLGWLQIAGLAAAPAGGDGEGPLGEALALARSMPHAFEEGMVLYRRGVTRGGRGGREDLIASITIFDQLGARPFAERARRELDGADGVPDLVAPGRDSLD
jgi:hypothetical protein